MELIVQISGEIQKSNFSEYKNKMLAVIDDINTDLQTDEDFAAAEITVRHCKEAEKAIDAAREQAMENTADIAELFKSMTEVSNKLQETRLSLSKQIKSKKEEVKGKVVADGIKSLADKMAEIDAHPAALQGFIINNDDFTKAVKGKRTVDSMWKAVDKVVSQYLDGFGRYCSKVGENLSVLEPYIEQYSSLFVDQNNLLQMDAGAMVEIIHSRIAKFKADEEALRLKAEAKAKEEKEQEVETEKPIHNIDTLPPRQAPKTGREQVTPPDPAGTDDPFVMTVNLLCTTEKAKEIARTVHAALDQFGPAVVSVNLNRPSVAA